jgi:hypothetical protein
VARWADCLAAGESVSILKRFRSAIRGAARRINVMSPMGTFEASRRALRVPGFGEDRKSRRTNKMARLTRIDRSLFHV